MKNYASSIRLLALMLVVVLGLSLAAPARAEALEPLTILAIVGAGVVVVIIVVFLIVANTKGSRLANEAQPLMVVCVESDAQLRNCSSLPQPGQPADLSSAIALPPPAPQS